MGVYLTPEIRTYATNIASIGNRMSETSNKFGKVSEKITSSKDSIQQAKNEYSVLLEEFKSQERSLVRLKPPALLKQEHEELVISFKKYVNATEMCIYALDVENERCNEEELSEGQAIQIQASSEIVSITKIMAKKLGI